MTTSTNDTDGQNISGQTGGALADALTLVRALLTPLIMFIIIKAWSAKPGDTEGFISLDIKLVVLASILFAVAAFTDLLDDYLGGRADGGDGRNLRKFGWFDDIADSVLILGTLVALVWALGKADILHWSFAVPVMILVLRDIIIGLTKGYSFSKYGLLETRLGDLKSALGMFATCTLIASPWLTNIVDNFRAAKTQNPMQIYDAASTWIWNIGLAALWITAILAIWTGFKLLTTKPVTPDEAVT